jgi:phytol kinase
MIHDFIQRAMPGITEIVIIIPFSLMYGMFGAYVVGYLREVKQFRVAYTRKIFHFIIFTSAAVLHFTGGLPWVMLFGGSISLIVLYGVYKGEGYPFYEALAREKDRPRRTLFIIIPLVTTALGGIITNLFFAPVGFIGYIASGWGDAVGEPAGVAFGKHEYRVPSMAGVKAIRSLEGSFAIFLSSLIGTFFALIIAGYAVFTCLWVAAVCSLAGTIVEAFSTHGIDNLTVQVAASGTAYLLLAI